MFYKIPCGLALSPSGGIGRLRLLPKAGDAKAALPRKSDGDGAPSLPWGNGRAAARIWCGSTS